MSVTADLINKGKLYSEQQCSECSGTGFSEKRDGTISIGASKSQCSNCSGVGKIRSLGVGIRLDDVNKYLKTDSIDAEAAQAIEELTKKISALLDGPYLLLQKQGHFWSGPQTAIDTQVQIYIKNDGSFECKSYKDITNKNNWTGYKDGEKTHALTLSDLCSAFDFALYAFALNNGASYQMIPLMLEGGRLNPNSYEDRPVSQCYKKGYGLLAALWEAHGKIEQEAKQRQVDAIRRREQDAANKRENDLKSAKTAYEYISILRRALSTAPPDERIRIRAKEQVYNAGRFCARCNTKLGIGKKCKECGLQR